MNSKIDSQAIFEFVILTLCMYAYLFFHFIVHAKDGVSRVHFMQGVDFFECILEFFHWVNLKPKHVPTTLKMTKWIFWYIRRPETTEESPNNRIISEDYCKWHCTEVTWRELSITSARPNFESLILIDHLRGNKICYTPSWSALNRTHYFIRETNNKTSDLCGRPLY